MATVAKGKEKLVLSREVKAFAKERGLTAYLPAIVESLDRIFPDAIRVATEVHQDPEIAELRSLLFEVEVPWPRSKQALEAKHLWYDAMRVVCPGSLHEQITLLVRRRP